MAQQPLSQSFSTQHRAPQAAAAPPPGVLPAQPSLRSQPQLTSSQLPPPMSPGTVQPPPGATLAVAPPPAPPAAASPPAQAPQPALAPQGQPPHRQQQAVPLQVQAPALPQRQHQQQEPPLGHQQQCGDSKAKVPPLASISLTKPPPELPLQLQAEFQGDNELLGEGAFAVVRRLRHRRTGEAVALKVVEKYPLHIRNMLPQLQREVRIQGNLRHRHILRLITCHEDEAYVYMVLEHCAGGSLRSLCAQQPAYRLPEARAARYFVQILQGVDFMHQHFCVHRDLKPENMLLTGEDEVRICDFGWSAEVQVEQALRTTCGTPHYWAPEIFEGNPQDVAVDLWSLGTLIYELLVGHPPFWGNMEELRRKVLAVDLRYPPGLLSNEAVQLFFCLLQKEPRSRMSAGRLMAEHPWVLGAVMPANVPGAIARTGAPNGAPGALPVEVAAAPPAAEGAAASTNTATPCTAGLAGGGSLVVPVVGTAASQQGPPAQLGGGSSGGLGGEEGAGLHTQAGTPGVPARGARVHAAGPPPLAAQPAHSGALTATPACGTTVLATTLAVVEAPPVAATPAVDVPVAAESLEERPQGERPALAHHARGPNALPVAVPVMPIATPVVAPALRPAATTSHRTLKVLSAALPVQTSPSAPAAASASSPSSLVSAPASSPGTALVTTMGTGPLGPHSSLPDVASFATAERTAPLFEEAAPAPATAEVANVPAAPAVPPPSVMERCSPTLDRSWATAASLEGVELARAADVAAEQPTALLDSDSSPTPRIRGDGGEGGGSLNFVQQTSGSMAEASVALLASPAPPTSPPSRESICKQEAAASTSFSPVPVAQAESECLRVEPGTAASEATLLLLPVEASSAR